MSSSSVIELVTLPPAQVVAAPPPATGRSPTTLAPGNSVSVSTGPPAATPPAATPPAATPPAATPPAATSPAAPPPAATATTTPAPAPSANSSHALPAWVQAVRAVLKTCSSAIKFAIAVLGVWAVYIAWQALKLQRWTASNDALQSCQALESRSEYCNRTMDAGVRPPPSWKRDLPVAITWVKFGDPLVVAASTVSTVAAIIFASILIRPRLVLFPPLLSNVRLLPVDFTGDQIYLLTFRWIRTSWLAFGPLLEFLRCLANAVVIGVVLDDNDTDKLSKGGKQIGVSYESDDDEEVDDESIKQGEQISDTASKLPGYPALTASELVQIDESFHRLCGSLGDKDFEANETVIGGLLKRRDLKELEWQSLLHFLDCLLGSERCMEDLPNSLRRILARLGLKLGQKTFSDGPLALNICHHTHVRQSMLLDVLEELLKRRNANGDSELWKRANDRYIPRSSRVNRILRDNLLSAWYFGDVKDSGTTTSLKMVICLEESRRAHWAPMSENPELYGYGYEKSHQKQKSDVPLSRNVHPNPPPLATRKTANQPSEKWKRGWPRKSMLSSGKVLSK